MSEELRPCPFCGKTVSWCECGHCSRIECKKCGFLFEVMAFADNEHEHDKAESAKRWNKRTVQR